MNHHTSAHEGILEIQVNAALSGHDLGPFERVTDTSTAGYQARCRRCGQTAWVGENGLHYSLLDETCNVQNDTGYKQD